MEPVTFGMASFSLMSGMGGLGLSTSATATAVATAATATTAATVATTATVAAATTAAAATVSMPLWLPVAGAAGALVGLGFLVKAQLATDEQQDTSPSGAHEQQHGAVLGCGSFGVVTLHREGAMTYALKSVPHKLLKHRDMEKTLSIEQQALTQCQASPFVVRYYGPVYREEDTVLVMEMLQDLCSTYSNAGLWGNEEHVKMHIACVAEALAFAHARNIWHRDIKPQNLLLNPHGHCKLADFGSAKVSAADRTWSCVGTPEYRAPELVQGAGYNEAVDWWALGCVLFELCSRKQLFPGKAHEVFSAIVTFDPSSPNSFSGCHCRDAVGLLQCLCAAKPQNRIRAAGIRQHAWYEGFGWPQAKPDSVRSQCPTLLTKLATALASSQVCGQSASADSSSLTPAQSDVATAQAKAKFLARVLKKT